jgi:hypothetical protein
MLPTPCTWPRSSQQSSSQSLAQKWRPILLSCPWSCRLLDLAFMPGRTTFCGPPVPSRTSRGFRRPLAPPLNGFLFVTRAKNVGLRSLVKNRYVVALICKHGAHSDSPMQVGDGRIEARSPSVAFATRLQSIHAFTTGQPNCSFDRPPRACCIIWVGLNGMFFFLVYNYSTT